MNAATDTILPQRTTVFVDNLAADASEQDLRSLFGRFGSVSEVRLIPGPSRGSGVGCCYLTMKGRPARAAIAALDGRELMGSVLRVSAAHAHASVADGVGETSNDEYTKAFSPLHYQVVSVEWAAMPPGTQGDDWYRYILSTGNSLIAGFHRGTREEVDAYARECAGKYNERSIGGKSKRILAPPKPK
jgi:RNA recognition motif-containing protein